MHTNDLQHFYTMIMWTLTNNFNMLNKRTNRITVVEI